jgi:hypothetical protein
VSDAFAPTAGPGSHPGRDDRQQDFFTGARLPQFQIEIIGMVALMVFTVLGHSWCSAGNRKRPNARA